jgi:hypothetical protein
MCGIEGGDCSTVCIPDVLSRMGGIARYTLLGEDFILNLFLELVQISEAWKKRSSAYLVSNQTYRICNRNLNGSPMTNGKV